MCPGSLSCTLQRTSVLWLFPVSGTWEVQKPFDFVLTCASTELCCICFICVQFIDLHISDYLKYHEDFKWSQVVAWERSWKKTIKGASSAHSTPSKVFQGPFGKFEPINKLSDRKPFHFFVHPPTAAQPNSTQSVSPLVFSLSLRFVLLPWLYWVGPSAERNTAPHMQLKLFIKEGPGVKDAQQIGLAGEKKHMWQNMKLLL